MLKKVVFLIFLSFSLAKNLLPAVPKAPRRSEINAKELCVQKVLTLIDNHLVFKYPAQQDASAALSKPYSEKDTRLKQALQLFQQRLFTVIDWINHGMLQHHFAIECELLNVLNYPRNFQDIKPHEIRRYREAVNSFFVSFSRYQMNYHGTFKGPEIMLFNNITDLVVSLKLLLSEDNFDFTLADLCADYCFYYPKELVKSNPKIVLFSALCLVGAATYTYYEDPASAASK